METEHFDVLIIGAGLSGIGAGYAVQTHCKGKRYAILEGREAIGGTWDLFRYPGVRSDTDMYTLGYAFKPWTKPYSMADGASILQYVRDTAREFGIDKNIRFKHQVRSAAWSSTQARWTIEVEVGAEKTLTTYTCGFLYLCSGYYDYAEGFAPQWPGQEEFGGQVVHPQFWPQSLDYTGKQVVIVGSGATAITLVPSMTDKAAHVTMLQRSPSYVLSLPSNDGIANTLRRCLPAKLAHKLVRAKNVAFGMLFYAVCRRKPEFAKKVFRGALAKQLPADFDFQTHFKPRYDPWDERVCFVRDGDMFAAISAGRASMETDSIDHFTQDGLVLASGKTIQADIVVTATGLKLKTCAGLQFTVDGHRIDLGKTFAYQGMMLSGVPNMAFCVGYTNASWTLRADLASRFVTRLINYMQRSGQAICTPTCDASTMTPEPLIGLRSGYVLRAVDSFPKQGAAAPWRMAQNYLKDMLNLRWRSVVHPNLAFSRAKEIS
ncbi:MAG: FAD-containing monooxygenase EthA [Comamonadaceae bacterium PBBC2]|nr:MAG: FAD-containing monooxygenase EthA [Comamonadaceae bacterium PBBC2]